MIARIIRDGMEAGRMKCSSIRWGNACVKEPWPRILLRTLELLPHLPSAPIHANIAKPAVSWTNGSRLPRVQTRQLRQTHA
jgi:hypothetical protein